MVEYRRTLFIPSMVGQYKVWKSNVAPFLKTVDKVFQLGNIVGCNNYMKDKDQFGPNEAILHYVIARSASSDKWVHLIGPNEIAALNFPNEWTNDKSNSVLRNAWVGNKKVFQVAAVDKGRLVTHGGLTYGEWVSIGSPKDVNIAAEKLNEKYAETIYQGPCFKLGDPPNYAANPIWADPIMELFSSWVTAPEACPFDQLHGSGSLNNIIGREHFNDKNSPLHYVDKVRFNNTGSITTIKGAEITSIDFDLPEHMVPSLPRPFRLYIEKTPIPTLETITQE